MRKRRVELRLLQKNVAQRLGVCENTVTHWETGYSQPQVKHYPAIIGFLGHYPFDHETESLSGKIRQIRYCNGFGVYQCAEFLHVSYDAIKRWEGGSPVTNRRLRGLIEAVWQDLSNR
jgi:DNA-binding transcriptional regulator YiaG